MNGRIARIIAIGLATGLFSGLLGVGGGFVMVPGMVYVLRTRQHEAHGTSLLVIIPVAIVGALILGKSHDVDVAVAGVLALGAVGGAVAGARLTRDLSGDLLRQTFGVVAVAIGLLGIADAAAHALHGTILLEPGFKPSGLGLWLIGITVGLVAGLLSGLLGIGGGAVMVPAMVLLMGLSQHLAQGTSLAVIIPTAISGSITHFRLGNIRLATAAWLSAGGVLGAALGALAALETPDQALRLLFGLYLCLTGARMVQAPKSQATAPRMVTR